MGQSSQVPAAERTIRILKFLGSRPLATSASTIARELGFPRSSTYHLLSVLEREGFVVHLPDEGRYALSTELLELGSPLQRRDWLARMGRAVLDRLVQDVGSTGHLAVLDDREVVYLLERRPERGDLLVTDERVRLPAHLTASGRALLAEVAPAHRRAVYPTTASLTRRTDRGPSSLVELREELERTHLRGWAEEIGEVSEGFASVGAAVFNHEDRPIAALAVTFRHRDRTATQRAELPLAVMGAAAELTARCGGVPRPAMHGGSLAASASQRR